VTQGRDTYKEESLRQVGQLALTDVWHGGGWTPEKRAEYARREVEIQTAVTRELAAIRIFRSNDLPQRERRRLEVGYHPPPLCGRRAFARPQYVRPIEPLTMKRRSRSSRSEIGLHLGLFFLLNKEETCKC
jgi:hypothetical protein